MIINADCREVLATLPANSVDAVVTDPPYFLTSIAKRFGKAGSAPAQHGSDGRFKRLSGGFMNQGWDSPESPVIDPGFAHWLAGFVDGEGCFSVHRKVVNGYETYDCQFTMGLRSDDKPILVEIQRHLGGIGSIADRPARETGNGKPQARFCVSSKTDCQKLRAIFEVFPLRAKKARDFEIWSHALDSWIAHSPGEWGDMAWYRRRLMDVKLFGSTYRAETVFHYSVATALLRVLKPGGHLLMFGGTRTYHRMACAVEDAGFEVRDQLSWIFGSGFPKSHDVSKALSDEYLSDQWEGWGTALKPAHEPILLARKPLTGTVAGNVMLHGTGAINIDDCRVPIDANADASQLRTMTRSQRTEDLNGHEWGLSKAGADTPVVVRADGRWPANLIHDGSEEVVSAFPVTTSGSMKAGTIRNGENKIYGKGMSQPGKSATTVDIIANSGSAARFFYCAKASKADREEGNGHPTVKPTDLMRYLCRLITPPGGTVLDPFAGSGSTGKAAHLEGFKFIGIELDPQFAEIASRRANCRIIDADTFALIG